MNRSAVYATANRVPPMLSQTVLDELEYVRSAVV